MEKTPEEIAADAAAEALFDEGIKNDIAAINAAPEPAVPAPVVPAPVVPAPGETGPEVPAGETGPGETALAAPAPGETGPGETGPGETAPAAPAPGETGPAEAGPTGYEFRIPNKGKFESDESFEKRVQLLDLVKRRKLATTPEQRQKITDDIKIAKGQIKSLNGTDRFVNPLNQKSADKIDEPVDPAKPPEQEDETLTADKERLAELGGATKEDIAEIVQQSQLATDVKNTLDTFIERHNELGDEDTREVFFDFVDSNYNWQGKGGNELMTVLELARENMFKPSETIQERVLEGADVATKVNAMQFPGGSVAKVEHSPEKQQSIDELTAIPGMSEEKAIELISD